MRRVREHRALGHRTILITGALDFAVEGLRPLFDEIVAAEMSVRPDGTLSGEMLQVPPTGETRAQILARLLRRRGPAPRGGVAYADSTSDLPLLEAVGFPVAVNPETRLAAIARKRGWLVEHWSKAPRRPPPAAPDRPADGRARTPPERSADVEHRCRRDRSRGREGRCRSPGPSSEAEHEGAAGRGDRAARAGAGRVGAGAAGAVRSGRSSTPTVDEPELPGPGWHRVHTRARRHLRLATCRWSRATPRRTSTTG